MKGGGVGGGEGGDGGSGHAEPMAVLVYVSLAPKPGSLPQSSALLSRRTRAVGAVSTPSIPAAQAAGMVDARVFPARLICCSAASVLQGGGSVPERLLALRSRLVRRVSWLQRGGRVPVNVLLCRARLVRELR